MTKLLEGENKDEQISTRLKQIYQEMNYLDERKKNLKCEIEYLKTHCSHAITKHHPRPVAESDSWDECLICGKEL
jgi:predicted nuclease with TOPRIM domain